VEATERGGRGAIGSSYRNNVNKKRKDGMTLSNAGLNREPFREGEGGGGDCGFDRGQKEGKVRHTGGIETGYRRVKRRAGGVP